MPAASAAVNGQLADTTILFCLAFGRTCLYARRRRESTRGPPQGGGIGVSTDPDVCGSDHLAPLLGVCSDELCKISRRARQGRATQIGKPGLHFRIAERDIDLF